MPVAIDLQVDFKADVDTLTVSFTVTNNSDVVIYLTNVQIRRIMGKGPVPDKDEAFVYFDGKEVHITKRRPPIPMKTFTPRPFYITPLQPESTFSEEILLELPLKANIPYHTTNAKGDAETAEQVVFSLGYYRHQSSMRAVEVESGGKQVFKLRAVQPPDFEPGMEIKPWEEEYLISEPVEMQFPILPYKEKDIPREPETAPVKE
jgi:hypothetical protein